MYGFPARVLHRLALGNTGVLETGFALERRLFSKRSPDSVTAGHVFVSGLARSGTTALMRALYDSGEFGSLTYRDMPFVLAPNLWARVTQGSRQRMAAMERAHGDGIQIGFDSPEALEEVFWRVFGGDYIRGDRLVSIQPSDESIAAFRAYVELINRRYTLLIPIFRFFIQPMSSKLFVSKERNSRWYLLGFRKNSSQAALNSANVS